MGTDDLTDAPSAGDRSGAPSRANLIALLTYVWALSLDGEPGIRTVPQDLVVEIADLLLMLAVAGELSFMPGNPAERLRDWLRSTHTPRT